MTSQIDAKTARLPIARGERTESEDYKDVWDKNEKRFNTKRHSEYHDPCQDFANKSIRCLHRNSGDKDMCQDYFQAYRDCKKEWTTRRRWGKAGLVAKKEEEGEGEGVKEGGS